MRGMVGALVLVPSLAIAAPPRTARLDVSGTCELRGITARANELAGRPAITSDGAALISITTSEIDRGGIAATVVLSDEQHVTQPLRAVSAATCDALETSLAIVLSLVVQQEPAASASLPVVPDVPPPPAAVPPRATLVVLHPRSVRPVVQMAMGYATSGESQVAAGIDRGALGAELQIATADGEPEYGRVDIVTVRLAGTACYRVSGLGACGVAFAGLVHGSSSDLMFPDVATRPIAGLGARLEWRQSLGNSAGVRVFADVTQLIVTTQFLVDDVPAWKTSARAATVGAGMFFQLP